MGLSSDSLASASTSSRCEIGRPGIAPDVAHAGLEQRLGDGEDALAAQDLAGPVPELLDVLRERPLTHPVTRSLRSYLLGDDLVLILS